MRRFFVRVLLVSSSIARGDESAMNPDRGYSSNDVETEFYEVRSNIAYFLRVVSNAAKFIENSSLSGFIRQHSDWRRKGVTSYVMR